MRSVISSTYDDNYFFYLPIVIWSWNKIGIEPIVILQQPNDNKYYERDALMFLYCTIKDLKYRTLHFTAPEHKVATYAQCARLYAATAPLPDNEILITGDVDMAVFNQDYFNQAENPMVNIFGVDLVPRGQYPICYISMPVQVWRVVMGIGERDTLQTCLDKLLGHIDCENFRGNYWAKDQETAFDRIANSGAHMYLHYRAKPGTQFATCRADRDGWPEETPAGLIDAHLPRPGYTDENFQKILKLFNDVYPDENLQWMIEYRQEYLKLI